MSARELAPGTWVRFKAKRRRVGIVVEDCDETLFVRTEDSERLMCCRHEVSVLRPQPVLGRAEVLQPMLGRAAVLPVSQTGRTLMGDVRQLAKDHGDNGWIGFERGFNGYTFKTAQALARRGLAETRKVPGGFQVRLTEQGDAWLEHHEHQRA